MGNFGVLLAIVFVACLFDYLTGVFKAFATHSVCTQKMREGLCHKVAILGCEFLAMAIDVCMDYVDLGITFDTGLSPLICAAIVVMEVLSVYENLCEINPELKDNSISKFFKVSKGDE